MRMRHLLTIAAMLAATTACKREAVDASAKAGEEAIAGQASDDGTRGAPGTRDPSSAPAPGGAFARKPGFQLPVPVSTTPMTADSIPPSRPVDPVGIRTALMDGMQEAGANIQVQVGAGGIVSLSGEVATIAELQRAHYLARAQPGVVEVDYRQLRVRQR